MEYQTSSSKRGAPHCPWRRAGAPRRDVESACPRCSQVLLNSVLLIFNGVDPTAGAVGVALLEATGLEGAAQLNLQGLLPAVLA